MSVLTRIFSQNAERDLLIGQAYAAIFCSDEITRNRVVAQLIQKHGHDEVAAKCVIDLIEQVSSRSSEAGVCFAAFAATLATDRAGEDSREWAVTGSSPYGSTNAVYNLSRAAVERLSTCIEKHEAAYRPEGTAKLLEAELVGRSHASEVRRVILAKVKDLRPGA